MDCNRAAAEAKGRVRREWVLAHCALAEVGRVIREGLVSSGLLGWTGESGALATCGTMRATPPSRLLAAFRYARGAIRVGRTGRESACGRSCRCSRG
jgi:hypothetical protein